MNGANWEQIARNVYKVQQQWQEFAENVWEELQQWHHDDCPTGDYLDVECTCHNTLKAQWDVLTDAETWADEDEDEFVITGEVQS